MDELFKDILVANALAQENVKKTLDAQENARNILKQEKDAMDLEWQIKFDKEASKLKEHAVLETNDYKHESQEGLEHLLSELEETFEHRSNAMEEELIERIVKLHE